MSEVAGPMIKSEVQVEVVQHAKTENGVKAKTAQVVKTEETKVKERKVKEVKV